MPDVDETTLEILEQPTHAIEPRREMFPAAQVEGATSLAQVLEAWKERGLEPTEISRSDLLLHLAGTVDPLDGRLTWQSKGKMDALMVIWMAVTMAISVGQYFTQGAGQVDMPTREVVVIMGYKDGKLSIAQPVGNQLAAEKLLTTVLSYFWAKNNGDPVERFLRAFGWESR